MRTFSISTVVPSCGCAIKLRAWPLSAQAGVARARDVFRHDGGTGLSIKILKFIIYWPFWPASLAVDFRYKIEKMFHHFLLPYNNLTLI